MAFVNIILIGNSRYLILIKQLVTKVSQGFKNVFLEDALFIFDRPFSSKQPSLKCKHAVHSFVGFMYSECNLPEWYRNLRTGGIVKSVSLVFCFVRGQVLHLYFVTETIIRKTWILFYNKIISLLLLLRCVELERKNNT